MEAEHPAKMLRFSEIFEGDVATKNDGNNDDVSLMFASNMWMNTIIDTRDLDNKPEIPPTTD